MHTLTQAHPIHPTGPHAHPTSHHNRCRETGELFAIKTIRKSKVSRLDSLRREIDILQTVDHPQIIKVRASLCLLTIASLSHACLAP